MQWYTQVPGNRQIEAEILWAAPAGGSGRATSVPWGCRDLSGGRAIKRNTAQRGQPPSEPEVTTIFSEDNHGAINTAAPVAFNPGARAVGRAGWGGCCPGAGLSGDRGGDTARGSCPPAGPRVLGGMLRVAALPSVHPVPFPPPLPLIPKHFMTLNDLTPAWGACPPLPTFTKFNFPPLAVPLAAAPTGADCSCPSQGIFVLTGRIYRSASRLPNAGDIFTQLQPGE